MRNLFKRIATLLAAAFLLLNLPAPAEQLPAARVTLGDEIFLRSAWRDLHGRCIGVITNQTGVTSRLTNIVDAIEAHGGICIRAIYSPEHGLRGDRPAGAYVSSYTDERTGLPVYSLYGPQRYPTARMLQGVDVLLFDIQDVGSRTYTYISTMAYAMRAAKQYGKQIWVLDRPNPIGGEMVEGPVLDPKFRSFIGLYPIAMRHGMTVGELARMFNGAFGIGADLRVIPMEGWHRSMLWPATGLQWVQTSPNMPEWSTAVVYPCSGLLDGVALSGGIGTTRPFKYIGSTGIDAYRLASTLNGEAIPGVYFRPAYWTPFFGEKTGAERSGVELDVFDANRFPAVSTAVAIAAAVRDTSPSAFRINVKQLDVDWGTDTIGTELRAGWTPQQILNAWQPQLARFKILRSRYLLYN